MAVLWVVLCTFVGYGNDRFFSHTNPCISNVNNNADVPRCSYFELGLPVEGRDSICKVKIE